MSTHISLWDVFYTRELIKKFIRVTPIHCSSILSSKYNASIYLKLENQQVTGSFKIRGALSKLIRNLNKIRDKEILTVSMGNHALAIAYASKLLGLKAKIIMPRNATSFKKQRVKAYGVNLEIHGDNYDEAEAYALNLSRDEKYYFVSPYNDIDIILGQATLGLEIIEQNPYLDAIIVPVGGGGLISGISFVIKNISPRINVIGVQSEASPAMYESIRAGRIINVSLKPSIAEGLHGNIEHGSITFDFVKKYIDEILLVSEEDIKESIRELYYEEGILLEGAAAVTLAALKRYIRKFRDKRVCLVFSGGNIDPEHMLEIFYSEKNTRA